MLNALFCLYIGNVLYKHTNIIIPPHTNQLIPNSPTLLGLPILLRGAFSVKWLAMMTIPPNHQSLTHADTANSTERVGEAGDILHTHPSEDVPDIIFHISSALVTSSPFKGAKSSLDLAVSASGAGLSEEEDCPSLKASLRTAGGAEDSPTKATTSPSKTASVL